MAQIGEAGAENHGDAVGARAASIREIQEAFPEDDRPAYTTVQTTIYRLEAKKAVKRVKKVGNFHIFEAAVSRNAAQRRLIDDLLGVFGGRTQPVMAHLIESDDLNATSSTMAQYISDLPVTSPHGSDFSDIRKFLELHRFERSTRHSNGTPRQAWHKPQKPSTSGR